MVPVFVHIINLASNRGMLRQNQVEKRTENQREMKGHRDFSLALIWKIEHSTPGSGLSPYLLLCQCVESNVFLNSKYAESELAAYKVDYLKESFQSDKLNKFNFDTFTVVKGTKNIWKPDKKWW